MTDLRSVCLAIFAMLVVVAPINRADEVILNDGRHFEGKIVVETDDKIIIETTIAGITGQVPVAKSDIASLTRSADQAAHNGVAGAANVAATQAGIDAQGAEAPAPPGPLKDGGLIRRGNAFLLSDEAGLLDQLKSLAETRSLANSELGLQQSLERQITKNRQIIESSDKEWHHLDTRLEFVDHTGGTVDAHNALVTRMNRLLMDTRDAAAAIQDLEEKASNATAPNQAKYVDAMVALAPKIDELVAKYQHLADDTAVKDALAEQKPPAQLGPSSAFAAAVQDFQKWQMEVDSQAIPLYANYGTFEVDAQVNGQAFKMAVDTGASFVCLSAEAAEKAGINPGAKDPTLHMHIADGRIIDEKLVMIESVRVGRFTVKNVPCVVAPSSMAKAPLLLGGSFLNHFIVKMEPGKSQMHLTAIRSNDKSGSKSDSPTKSDEP